jgi:hypothetical protein
MDTHGTHSGRPSGSKRARSIQIPVDSYDTAAVLLKLQDRNLLVVASYDPRDGSSTAARDAALSTQL